VYDPVETDASYRYLQTLVSELGDGFAVIGEWAVHLHVDERFRRAIGVGYLRPGDIDVVISSKTAYVTRFKKAISEMGFVKGGLPFRYQLILDRESLEVISEKDAKEKMAYELINIYLDLFSEKKVKLGTWVITMAKDILANSTTIDNIPIASVKDALDMKVVSLKERENIEKKEKDACDIYALLQYSETVQKDVLGNETLLLLANDYSEIIASHLFNDTNYSGIVRRNIEGLI